MLSHVKKLNWESQLKFWVLTSQVHADAKKWSLPASCKNDNIFRCQIGSHPPSSVEMFSRGARLIVSHFCCVYMFYNSMGAPPPHLVVWQHKKLSWHLAAPQLCTQRWTCHQQCAMWKNYPEKLEPSHSHCGFQAHINIRFDEEHGTAVVVLFMQYNYFWVCGICRQ